MDSKILLVVPTYNECDNIEPLAARVLGQLPGANILVVDDGSPDGTGEVADALSRRDPRVRVIHRPEKLGLGTAYIEGFRYGLARDYDFLFEMGKFTPFSLDQRIDILCPEMVEIVNTDISLC